MCFIKGKIGKEGPSGPYGLKGATGQFSFYNLNLFSYISLFILGPPGPPGNDGLPGGKSINQKANMKKVIFLLQILVDMDIQVRKVNVVNMVLMVPMYVIKIMLFLNFLLSIYFRLMVADVLDHFLDHQGILYVLHIYSYHGILLSFFFSRD